MIKFESRHIGPSPGPTCHRRVSRSDTTKGGSEGWSEGGKEALEGVGWVGGGVGLRLVGTAGSVAAGEKTKRGSISFSLPVCRSLTLGSPAHARAGAREGEAARAGDFLERA